jgi:hypothetical protein
MIIWSGRRRRGCNAHMIVSEVEVCRMRDGNDDMTKECEVRRDDDKVRQGATVSSWARCGDFGR